MTIVIVKYIMIGSTFTFVWIVISVYSSDLRIKFDKDFFTTKTSVLCVDAIGLTDWHVLPWSKFMKFVGISIVLIFIHAIAKLTHSKTQAPSWWTVV